MEMEMVGDDDDDGDETDRFFEKNPKFPAIQAEYVQGKIGNIGAIDWGGKYFISANVKHGDRESLMYIHADEYHRLAEYKHNKRDCEKVRKFVTDNEKSLRINCEKQFGIIPSNKNRHYKHLTIHRLKLYRICEWEFYGLQLPLIKLRQYQLKQSIFQKMLNDLHGGEPTLIFIGVNPFSSSSPIKGYIKCPINEFIHAMLCCKLIIVVFVDEFNTTKSCSFCVRKSIEFYPEKRHVICRNCLDPANPTNPLLQPANFVRKFEMGKGKGNTVQFVQPARGVQRNRVMDRDDNSCRCILTVGLAHLNNLPKPQCFRRR